VGNLRISLGLVGGGGGRTAGGGTGRGTELVELDGIVDIVDLNSVFEKRSEISEQKDFPPKKAIWRENLIVGKWRE